MTLSMADYIEAKAAHPDAIVAQRRGDFYEVYFEDAVTAARELGLVLTRRGEHHGEPIPMVQFPVVRAESYVGELRARGLRVIVCEVSS